MTVQRRKECARPGCTNPAVVKYCSRECANKHQGELRRAANEPKIEFVRSGAIPKDLEDIMLEKFGHNAVSEVLREMEEHRREEDIKLAAIPRPLRVQQPLFDFEFNMPNALNPRASTKPPTAEEVEPYGNIQQFRGGIYAEMQRGDDIPIEDIELMRRSGPCVLGARMKKAPIISALSGERKWTVNSPNNKLAMVASANLKNLFLYHLNDILTVMDYGTLFGSLVWAEKTAEEVGVTEKGIGKSSKWYVVDKLQAAHPSKVERILRDSNMAFLGFRHKRSRMRPQIANIMAPQALVLTYNANFGSLYGNSLFDPAYNSWFWYEVVMRSCLRYLERMGVPVTVARAPSQGYTIRPDGTEVSNAEYALLVAGYAAHHSALFIPSDTDPQSGKELWQLEYLQTDQRGEQFISVLRFLSTQITRSMIVGDLASTQPSGEGGSYNLGTVHDKNTQVDNDQIFQNLLGQMNKYWITRYGQFNVDYNNPPAIWLSAAVLDPMERDTLMKLFATAGNVKIGDGSPLDWIDWEAAFQGVYAPVLSESERKALREQMTDEKVEVQKKFQEAQPKPQPQPDKNGNQPPPNRSVQNIAEWIAEGRMAPVLLTREQAQELVRPAGGVLNVELVRRPSDRVSNPEFEEKHPRDEKGRFASAESSAKSIKDILEGYLKEGGKDLKSLAERISEMHGGWKEALPYLIPGGEEMYEDLREFGFDEMALADQADVVQMLQDIERAGDGSWPGADPDKGIKGQFEVGDQTIQAVGSDVDGDRLASFAVINAIARKNLEEDGYDIAPVRKVAFAGSDRQSMMKYWKDEVLGVGPISADIAHMAEDLGENWSYIGGVINPEFSVGDLLSGDRNLVIMVNGSKRLVDVRHYLTHEYMHARVRQSGDVFGQPDEWEEEAFNETLARIHSYDNYGTWVPSGYDTAVYRLISSADAMGMSRAEFIDFVKDGHYIDGDALAGVSNRLIRAAASPEKVDVTIETAKVRKSVRVYSSLLKWFPDIYEEDIQNLARQRLGWPTLKQMESGM